ncbi:MAG: OmpA family protein [Oligoflexia bacterium]|nr:OmpA family protein [Oligoflexia bacterium]
MTSKILVMCFAIIMAVGCAKKKTALEEQGAEGANGQDTTIQSKDLGFDVQGSDSGNIQGLYTINFDFDKATLTAEGKANAQKNADWLKTNDGVMLQIEGHCDRHGSIEYNLALGERRANTVKNYMVNLGVDGNRLTTISYGKEKPLDTAESEAADARNRRANFIVQK